MTDVIAGMGAVPIGRQGENLVTRVVLPNIRGGAGGIVLLHQRSRDKNPYPVTVTEDAGHVYWVVSSADTAYDGMGRLELQWQGSGGEVLKSKIWQTYCQRSLTKPADPPEPWADYIGDITRDMAGLRNDIGDLTKLDTDAKSNLVDAVNEAASTGGTGESSPEDAVELLAAAGIVSPAADGSGKLYTDVSGKIFVI